MKGGSRLGANTECCVLTVFVTLAQSYFGSRFGLHCEVFVFLEHNSRRVQILVPFCSLNSLHGWFEPPGFNGFRGAVHLCFDQL